MLRFTRGLLAVTLSFMSLTAYAQIATVLKAETAPGVTVNLQATTNGELKISGGSSGTAAGALTDKSGSITTANTSQVVAAAKADRKYFFIQNVSGADLWINFTTAATVAQPSIKLAAGASFTMEASFISTEAINIIGATAGLQYTAKEF
jgi:NADPH-dependent curcumin reductase CurA